VFAAGSGDVIACNRVRFAAGRCRRFIGRDGARRSNRPLVCDRLKKPKIAARLIENALRSRCRSKFL
jgi:hypothetical protein